MKSGVAFAFILALSSGLFPAKASDKPLHFPPSGMRYAEARALLLRQGLAIAPDKVKNADRQFHEIGCTHEQMWTGRSWKDLPRIDCRALFLEERRGGWRDYIITRVGPEDKTVIDVDYAKDADGLPSIPPPLARDVPQLKGSYLKSRAILKSLGFTPARNHNADLGGRSCDDTACKHYVTLPETSCSGTGLAFCNAFWVSPNRRVLQVTTIGENPRIYFVQWSTWKALREDFGK